MTKKDYNMEKNITKGKILESAKQLLQDNWFFFKDNSIFDGVSSFGFYEVCFETKDGLKVIFQSDRGGNSPYWCSIGNSNTTFFIEDLFQLLHLDNIEYEEDFLKMIETTSAKIFSNKDKIIEAFNKKNSIETNKKLKELVSKNIEKRFGKH